MKSALGKFLRPIIHIQIFQPLILHWLIVVINAGFVTFHVVQCLNKFRSAAHTIRPQIHHLLQTCASRTILNCIKFNNLIRDKLITSWFYESQKFNSGICQSNLWTNQKIQNSELRIHETMWWTAYKNE